MNGSELLRREKILARQALTEEERLLSSHRIVERLEALPEYKKAETVLAYRAVKGEADLSGLSNKRLAYPLCISNTEMIALVPVDIEAWHKGYCGIPEPIRERSFEIAPEEIDLVLCPCTVFDENCRRMGMGMGFYDRFLPKCKNAAIIAVAFEVQKAGRIPAQSWDAAMDAVVTERAVYWRENIERNRRTMDEA